MADFYVIQDEKTGLFYDGRFGCTTDALRDTLARFVSVENATKDIKANRRRGHDVSNWRIVGINMIIDGSPIKPNLGVAKTGWAIECLMPGRNGTKCYWRGNKKDVKASISSILHGPQSAATASVFDTGDAANKAADTLRARALECKQLYKDSTGLVDIYSKIKFRVVKVGE